MTKKKIDMMSDFNPYDAIINHAVRLDILERNQQELIKGLTQCQEQQKLIMDSLQNVQMGYLHLLQKDTLNG
jgi:hypothetical protein